MFEGGDRGGIGSGDAKEKKEKMDEKSKDKNEKQKDKKKSKSADKNDGHCETCRLYNEYWSGMWRTASNLYWEE